MKQTIISKLVTEEIQSNKKINEGIFDSLMNYLDDIGKKAREKEALKQMKKKNPDFDESSKEFKKRLAKAREDTKDMSSNDAMDFYKNFLKTGKLHKD